MSARNLNKIFNPQQVAVIGASADPADRGYTVLRNLLDFRYQGVVYPVNPEAEAVQGIQTYPDLASLPKRPDLAVICGRPQDIVADIRQSCDAGVPGVVIISGGVRPGDAKGADLNQQIEAMVAKSGETRIIGPDALGVISPRIGLNASFTRHMPKPGHLALLSQSGALASAILDRAVEKGIGLSHFASFGNTPDVSFGDLIDYLGMDNSTRAIILYVQSIDKSRDFMSAARAFAKSKPIVAFKAGRFSASAQTAALQTGAMVAEDAVYEAAFQRAGVVRTTELDDIFDVAELVACKRMPRGARLAIISNSGGAALVAADALLAHQGILTPLSDETLDRLREALPEAEIGGNPVDLSDHAPPQYFVDATRIVIADTKVDGVLVLLTPQAMTNPTETAELLGAEAKTADKPVLAAWMGGLNVHKGIRILNRAGVPTHASPEHAVRAFMHLVSYTRNLKILYETPREIPINFPLNRRELHKEMDGGAARIIDQPPDHEPRVLSDHQTKRLLQAYEIPVCETYEAYSRQEAVRMARRIDAPVALKVLSTPQIIHKTDIGGVALNLQNRKQVAEAYDHIQSSVAAHRPDVQVNGVTIQEMLQVRDGFEMILGAKKDPTFGAVIMIGMGGFGSGIHQDRALGLPPINERLAWHMLEALRSWPLLQGYRGRPGIDLDRIIEVLMRFSYLVADYPEFVEIDINPLAVGQTDVVALDSVSLLEDVSQPQTYKPYQHLAIRPYPEEYVRHASLKGDIPVTLSPIRPEDEPLWNELLSEASPESIRFRFRSSFKQVTHEMATRHCYIDYEREISIVAEVEGDARRKLVGIGSLSIESDETVAEFAILVADAWQGKGLGSLLLDYCMEIAVQWGVQRIVAETDPQNTKMLTLFRRRGFRSKVDLENDVVYLHRPLA